MSYLRPTCSDAAARVTNLGLSRCVPSIWQGDVYIESVANIAPYVSEEVPEATERRPSQRPLDRRWDKSRGLVFGDRGHALKNRTWTPARGIVFASSTGQRRGYASRPIRTVASVAPKPMDSSPPAATIVGSSELKPIERPAVPAAMGATKGKKQEQMEKDLKALEKEVKEQAKYIQSLNAQLIEAKVHLIEGKKALEDDKEKIYSKGVKDGETQAKTNFEDEKKMFEIRHREMQAKIWKAEAQYPELKKDLEADIVKRERRLIEENKALDVAREAQEERLAEEKQLIEAEYRVANQFAADVKRKAKAERDELDERDRELTVREIGLRTRKAQRSDYNSYRSIWRNVQNERISLDSKLRSIAIQLVREGNKLKQIQLDQVSEANSAVSDQSQLTPQKLEELIAGVEALRNDLHDVDKELQIIGHESRHQTRGTRFEDTRLAAKSMGTALYIASVNPLRSIKARTQKDIDDTEDQIRNASNATAREELKSQKDAFSAEKVTVNSALELAFLDHRIQTFETLQNEPYVHKAVHLATFDLQLQVDRLSAHSFEGDRKSARSPEYWGAIRDTLKTANVIAKKTAQILEMKGEHKEHEKRLDAMIAKKIAAFSNQLQMKRAQLFGHHKSARVAAKRAPLRTVRVWGGTSSNSMSVDAFAPTVYTTPQDGVKHSENGRQMSKLRLLLNDATVSLDSESRAEKVRRYTELALQITDFEYRMLSKKLINSPRKRSEFEYNQRTMIAMQALKRKRDSVQQNLENGTEPKSLRKFSPPRRMPDMIENTAALVEETGSLTAAVQDDATNNSEPSNQNDAEAKLRTPRDETEAAKATCEFERIEDAENQVAASRGRITREISQLVVHEKAALGEVTSENSEQHRNIEIRTSNRSKAPLTRRQRLKHGQTNVSQPRESDGKRQARLRREVKRLPQSSGGLSDRGIADTIRPKQLETTQNPSSQTVRYLKDLSPKTSDNAPRHEQISTNVEQLPKTISSLSTGKVERADGAGYDNSESDSLDNLMTAWSSDVRSLNDVLTTSTKQPTVTSKATGLNMKPTSAKQAIYQPTGRRYIHDHLLWTDFLRQQESREGRVVPLFATTSVEETGSGSGDVSVVPSADCATAGASSFVSTEAARDDGNAKNNLQVQASLSTKIPSRTSFTNDTADTADTMAESEDEFIPSFEISPSDKKNALIASRNSTASFWRYSLYKNAAGEVPTRHYCTTFEQTEVQVAKFQGEKVVGFDLEWEKFKSKPGEDSAKRCVSLMQIAAEDKVALFHLAMFKGDDSTENLIPTSLRAFLEDPKIIKVGVNIGGDATRLRNCFGIEMQGNIELSHLYKLVTYGESDPAKVNRGLYALANQVKEVLHLPLAKGAVRTSSWSKRLNGQQTDYAVSDAYAGLRLYYELERRRKAMPSKPPRPAFHELALPILLGGGEVPPTKAQRGKQPVEAPEESAEEAVAAQEQDEGDASEDSEDIYDDPEDLEAFDAYVESQDADMTCASLPEITYPTLPALEDLLSESSDMDDDSSLPSDPITKPSASRRVPNLHTSQAVTADAWAADWQAQLPATYTLRVSQPQLRAYHLWHHQGFDLEEIPALLRKEPLALSTVVSYIAEVLQKEDLEFDAERVRELRARLPSSVRGRYAKLYANTGKQEA